MGIDTRYWVVLRAPDAPAIAPLDSEDWNPSEPASAARHLLSLLATVPSDPATRASACYLKNSIPTGVAEHLDGFAREALRTPDDRLVMLASVDGALEIATWKLDEHGDPSGRMVRRQTELEVLEMPESFVPDEPAVCFALCSLGTSDSVDVRLAKSLDLELRNGIREALASEGVVFRGQPTEGLRGVAVAIQKFVARNDHEGALLVYQTRVEGCFAWYCAPGREWPKHVRMPVASFANAPGDWLR
jgi:hypothetical protein